jgi:RND family efflux transporter MFP subunit
VKLHVLALSMVAAASARAEGPLTAPKVRLVAARAVQSSATEVVTGQLGPSKLLPLGFEVGGRLATSRVTRGEQVKAGQVLGSLDTDIIDAQVAQAEAGVAAAEAGAALAVDVAGRNEKLKAEGSVSDVQSKQAEAQSKAAQAQVAQARAGLAQARAGQKRHTLRALFSGTVIDAPDTVGGMVGPGTPVYVVMQLDPLVLKATLPEKFRAQVTLGQKVRVEAVDGDGVTEDAVIRVVLPSADPQTRRVPVEVLVPNADGRFLANTLAKLTVAVGGGQRAVVVPTTALGLLGGAHVFVVDDQGALRRVKVTVLERTPTQVTVVPETPVTQVADYAASLVEGASVTQR